MEEKKLLEKIRKGIACEFMLEHCIHNDWIRCYGELHLRCSRYHYYKAYRSVEYLRRKKWKK